MRDRGLRPSGRPLIYLILSLYAVFAIGAFVWTIGVSLKSNPEFFSTNPWAPPLDPQFGNYADAWTSANIAGFFTNSLLVTSTSVIATLGLASAAAYALSRIEFGARGITTGVFLIGLMIPGFLVIVPLYGLLEDLGLLGSLWGLVLIYIAVTIPFDIYVLTGFFRSLPDELEEAAFIDGATPFQVFRLVMMPLAAPGIASVGLLNVLTIWNEFFFAFVFLFDEKSYTVPIGILSLSVNATYSAAWVQLFAGLVIAMVPVLILFALFQDRITKGLTAGAVKG